MNARQEKFVQLIVKGRTHRQAYKEAYNAKYSDAAIDAKASALFNKPEVQEHYKKLMKKVESKAVMSAQERLEYLTDVIKMDLDAELKDKLRAVDIMNKMTGEYVTKVEGEVKVKKLEDLL